LTRIDRLCFTSFSGELQPGTPIPTLNSPSSTTLIPSSSPPFPFALLPKSWRTLPSLILIAQSREDHLRNLKTRASRWKYLFLIVTAFIAVGFAIPRWQSLQSAEVVKEEEQIPAAAEDTVAESEQCAVCLSARPDTILFPCAHYALCHACAERVDDCPVGLLASYLRLCLILPTYCFVSADLQETGWEENQNVPERARYPVCWSLGCVALSFCLCQSIRSCFVLANLRF